MKETVQGVTFNLAVPSEFTDKVVERDDSDGTKSTNMAFAPPFAKGATSRPVLMVSVNDIPLPDDVDRVECIDAFLSSYPKSWQNYKRTPAKVVSFNGKKYGYASWQGQRKEYGTATFQCWCYLTTVGPKVVTISFREEMPTKWDVRCEAAARTFQPR